MMDGVGMDSGAKHKEPHVIGVSCVIRSGVPGMN